MIPLLNRWGAMKRFIEGADRSQSTLLPACLDDWVDESNSVRVVDAFVDGLDLKNLGFNDVEPAATGRPVAAAVLSQRSRSALLRHEALHG